MIRVLFLIGLMATPAHAVTINELTGRGPGEPLGLDTNVFVGEGPCGFGASVVGDGCTVVFKDQNSPSPFGRFDPFGETWVDSQDREKVVFTVARATPFSAISFALTDAFDQLPSASLGASFFSLTVGDAIWSIPEREENGTLHWLEVVFDAPTMLAFLTFETRLNDGWGVSQARIAPAPPPPPPVPLPGAGLLLLGGLGLLVGLRRRDRG
jgi:hypothetical protein